MTKKSDKLEMVRYQTVECTVDLLFDASSEEFWATQQQMADLFGVSKGNISRHLKNLRRRGLLDDSVVVNFATTAADGKTYSVQQYSMAVLIAVGYRVNGTRAEAFRKWTSKIIAEYIVKGYSLNKERLRKDSKARDNLKDDMATIEAQFLARSNLTYDSALFGHFNVYTECAAIVAHLIAAKINIGIERLVDISVGNRWGRYWCKNHLYEKYGERVKNPHYYPALFYEQAKSNPQDIWNYPNAALEEFRDWLWRSYVPDGFLSYLKDIAKDGRVSIDPDAIVKVILARKKVKWSSTNRE